MLLYVTNSWVQAEVSWFCRCIYIYGEARAEYTILSHNWVEILKLLGKSNMAERREVWSVPVSTVFPLVLSYYKQGESTKNIKRLRSCAMRNFVWTSEKDNINLKLDYQQRIQLLAYFKQEKLGPFTPDIDVETGYFDVVGSDRR